MDNSTIVILICMIVFMVSLISVGVAFVAVKPSKFTVLKNKIESVIYM